MDAAQSFGQIPVDEAGSGHLRLHRAQGPAARRTGGVALSERGTGRSDGDLGSLRDESKADLNSSDLFHHDSRRFEVATSCVPLMAGLRSSLQLLDQTGSAQQRWERIRTLSGMLWQALQGWSGHTLLDAVPASGLVSFQINGDVPHRA